MCDWLSIHPNSFAFLSLQSLSSFIFDQITRQLPLCDLQYALLCQFAIFQVLRLFIQERVLLYHFRRVSVSHQIDEVSH